MNSWPTPVFACTVEVRNSEIMPTSHAAPAVPMKRPTFVVKTGTPTWRADSLAPPTAKIQLPARVRRRIQVATAATRNHHSTET